MAAVLANMYRKWSFFTAMIDNASLALAKANMTVFEQYAQLASGIDGAAELTATIIAEYDRSRQAILDITSSRELLDEVPCCSADRHPQRLCRSAQYDSGRIAPTQCAGA